MTAEKRVRMAIILTVIVLALQFVDVFLLHSQFKLTSINIISRLVSLIALMILSSIFRLNLKKFCFKSYGWFFEICNGILFSVVPFSIVYLFKFLYFYQRGYDNLQLTFLPSGFTEFEFSSDYFVPLLLYIISLLLLCIFKEFFYRGYLITQFSEKLGVNKAIFIQSILYMLSFVPTIAYYLINGKFDFQGHLMSFFLVCGHLFYNLLSGIKWGYLYKVNGTVWMSVTDHFIHNFLITSLFFTNHRLPEKWYIIEVISIQILSVIMCIPLYMRRDRENEIAAEEFALSHEVLKMGVDNYTPSIIRKSFDNHIKQRNSSTEGESFVPEEPVSLSDVSMPTEADLTLSVRGYAIDDSSFGYTTEVTDHDSSPEEKSKQYFDSVIGRESKTDTVTESDDSSNADSISGLVQDFFKKNFDKHTF